jgi:hypothetical protein
MAEERLSPWQTLFARALAILDAAPGGRARADDWSFGGGTALMLKYHHRVSKDIDISVADAQLLRHLSPRNNAVAEDHAWGYAEHADSIRLYVSEGGIDFTSSASLTPGPVTVTRILGREVRLETPGEIIAKSIWYRAASFTARDVFDFACFAQREPAALLSIQDILGLRRTVLLQRLEEREEALREDFAALDVLEFRPGFDDCLDAIAVALARIAPRIHPRAEQVPARYDLPPRLAYNAVFPSA